MHLYPVINSILVIIINITILLNIAYAQDNFAINNLNSIAQANTANNPNPSNNNQNAKSLTNQDKNIDNKASDQEINKEPSKLNLGDQKLSPTNNNKVVVEKKAEQNSSTKIIESNLNDKSKPSKKIIKKPKKLVSPNKKIIEKEKIIDQKIQAITESGRKISGDYFLQIMPKKSCDILTNTECFRRDKKDEEPYFHKTVINIFDNHIVAEQHFKETNPSKKIFLKVSNGDYQLTTTNDNLISFNVNNGILTNLVLVSGNLKRENIMTSKCILAEKYYGFFNAYNLKPKLSESFLFSNKDNFQGVRNIVIFSNIDNLEKLSLNDVYTVEVRAYDEIASIQNIKLCKKPKIDILNETLVNKAECKKRQECLTLLNSNPNINNIITDESCLGYFDSKREDYQTCSTLDNCEDFMVIKNCDLKFLSD